MLVIWRAVTTEFSGNEWPQAHLSVIEGKTGSRTQQQGAKYQPAVLCQMLRHWLNNCARVSPLALRWIVRTVAITVEFIGFFNDFRIFRQTAPDLHR
jgi:hypothetical protein